MTFDINEARRLHERSPNAADYCTTCMDSLGNPAPWPCATATVLGATGRSEWTGWPPPKSSPFAFSTEVEFKDVDVKAITKLLEPEADRLREEAVKRMAVGLDVPATLLKPSVPKPFQHLTVPGCAEVSLSGYRCSLGAGHGKDHESYRPATSKTVTWSNLCGGLRPGSGAPIRCTLPFGHDKVEHSSNLGPGLRWPVYACERPAQTDVDGLCVLGSGHQGDCWYATDSATIRCDSKHLGTLCGLPHYHSDDHRSVTGHVVWKSLCEAQSRFGGSVCSRPKNHLGPNHADGRTGGWWPRNACSGEGSNTRTRCLLRAGHGNRCILHPVAKELIRCGVTDTTPNQRVCALAHGHGGPTHRSLLGEPWTE